LELLKDIVGALAVVAAFVIGVLLIGRRLAPAGSLTGDRGFWVSLLGIAWSVETRIAALGLAACVAVLVTLGALVVVGDVPIEPFRLNAEQTIPAAFSGLLLVGAGSLGLLAGRLDRDRGAWAWLVLGAALIALAIDEMAELHERLEARTDLSSVVVVGPLALPLLIAFVILLPRMRAHAPAAALFATGAAFGLASQALDPIHNRWKTVLEEGLELGSGSLFVLALLLVVRGMRPGGASDRSPRVGAAAAAPSAR